MKKILTVLICGLMLTMVGCGGNKNVAETNLAETVKVEESVVETKSESEKAELSKKVKEVKEAVAKQKAQAKAEVVETASAEVNEIQQEDKNNDYAETPSEAEYEAYEEEEEIVEEVYEEDSNGSYLGYYELTAYTHTGNPMANGEYPYIGACACNSLPMGTVVYIEGHGTYTVCDRGGMPDYVIDIFMDSEGECIEFGRRGADVYIVD